MVQNWWFKCSLGHTAFKCPIMNGCCFYNELSIKYLLKVPFLHFNGVPEAGQLFLATPTSTKRLPGLPTSSQHCPNALPSLGPFAFPCTSPSPLLKYSTFLGCSRVLQHIAFLTRKGRRRAPVPTRGASAPPLGQLWPSPSARSARSSRALPAFPAGRPLPPSRGPGLCPTA